MGTSHAWLARGHRPHCVVVLSQGRVWRLFAIDPVYIVKVIKVIVLRRYVFDASIIV